MDVPELSRVYPLAAPLPIPMIEHLLKQRMEHLSSGKSVKGVLTEKAGWELLEQDIRRNRNAVFPYMRAFVVTGQLSTTWLLQTLTAHTPRKTPVTSQTLSKWHKRHLLRYQDHGLPETDSTAALFIARMTDTKRERNWLPTTLKKEEPHWWCWRQEGPKSPPIPCPVPLPEGLPPATLLWTPWAGATWTPNWLGIGNGLGSIRWAGANDEEGITRWKVTAQDLHLWDSAVAARSVPFPENAREILQVLAKLALQRLALQRLVMPFSQEEQVYNR